MSWHGVEKEKKKKESVYSSATVCKVKKVLFLGVNFPCNFRCSIVFVFTLIL